MKYHEISPEMTIGDLIESKHYGPFAPYIFTYMTPDHWNCKLKEYGFHKVGFIPTLHRLEELSQTDHNYIHHIYNKKDRLSEWDKEDPVLIHFPGPVRNRPYAVVIPGGGFNRQWGLIEGMSIASRINELGYSAFVLYYRVKQEPLMPKPLEDMYQSIRYIEKFAQEFEVQAGQYMIGGFSAGATIASQIGSTNLGWHTANVPRPEMIFLGYTAISMKDFYQAYSSLPAGHPAREGIAPFLRRVGGTDFTLESLQPYNLVDHIDTTYPPVYITANEDDQTVPFANSKLLAQTCSELNIPHRTKFGAKGGHSFGLGLGLEVQGWLEKAVDFWREVSVK